MSEVIFEGLDWQPDLNARDEWSGQTLDLHVNLSRPDMESHTAMLDVSAGSVPERLLCLKQRDVTPPALLDELRSLLHFEDCVRVMWDVEAKDDQLQDG